MLFEGNLDYLEGLYRAWREDPARVDPAWAAWLQALEDGRVEEPAPIAAMPASRRPEGRVSPPGPAAPPAASSPQGRLESLLWAYREVGYFFAHLNPLLP